ncbi:MAG TPA: rhodanese-like domain-containing protein [Nitrospiria bacterium]|nr:rhodanese-like domain-containing protein [Nitrospiria bacterium]
MLDWNISAPELKARLDHGDKLLLLDVREPWEYQLAHLEGSTLIPLREIQSRKGEIDPEADIVVLCHHGTRSMMALNYLRQQGFKKLKNLAGGIDAWSLLVDPRTPRYR